MADSRAFEIQLIETVKSIGRALGATGVSGSYSGSQSSLNFSEIASAINGVNSRLDTVKSYLDNLSERLTYDQDNNAFHILTNLYADGFITAGGVGSGGGGGGGGGGGVDLSRVWQSLRSNSETDFTNAKIHTGHLPTLAANNGLTASYSVTTNASGLATATGLTLGISDGGIAQAKISGLSTALSGKLDKSGDTMTGVLGLLTQAIDWNVTRNESKIRFLKSNDTISTNAPGQWWSGVSFCTDYTGFQLAVYGDSGNNELKFRKNSDNNTWNNWFNIYHSGSFIAGTDYVAPSALNNYLPLTGGTLTGNLSGPYVRATKFSSGEHVDDSYGPYSCTRGNDENENNGWCCYSFVRYQTMAFALGYDHSNSIILGTPATWNGGDGWDSKWLEVGASTFKYNSNNVYHAGNSNSTSVGWSASTLTLAGAISGATNIDSLLYFDTTNSRIGIGISTPTEKLDIQGGSVLISPRGAEYLKISSSDVNIFLDGYDSDGWCNLSYRSNGTTRLFINGVNGRVGIGVAAPAYMLDVSGDIHASTNILADGYMSASKLAVSGTAGDGTYGISLYNGANYIHSYGIWSGLTSVGGTCGQVSGTWATYFTMEGATNRGWIFRYETTNVASISAGGVMYASTGIYSPGYVTAGAAASSSDARLKDDIQTIGFDRAIDMLGRLRGCEWTWNGKKEYLEGKHGSGLIAQEVQGVMPWMVLDLNGELSLTYNSLWGVAIPVMQSHEERIKELEDKVALLEAENERLRRKQ